MHGLVLSELKKFVEQKAGPQAWTALQAEAGFAGKPYLPIQEYPDDETAALFAAAARHTGMPLELLLETFGEFLTQALMRLYGHLAKPSWRTLEFIEHAEHAIHKVVRVNVSGAMPPVLAVKRVGPYQILLRYSSHRKLCGLAKGIARGVARHYGESLAIEEHKCMHHGHAACEITMRVA